MRDSPDGHVPPPIRHPARRADPPGQRQALEVGHERAGDVVVGEVARPVVPRVAVPVAPAPVVPAPLFGGARGVVEGPVDGHRGAGEARRRAVGRLLVWTASLHVHVPCTKHIVLLRQKRGLLAQQAGERCWSEGIAARPGVKVAVAAEAAGHELDGEDAEDDHEEGEEREDVADRGDGPGEGWACGMGQRDRRARRMTADVTDDGRRPSAPYLRRCGRRRTGRRLRGARGRGSGCGLRLGVMTDGAAGGVGAG